MIHNLWGEKKERGVTKELVLKLYVAKKHEIK